jgi:hypothetical protein
MSRSPRRAPPQAKPPKRSLSETELRLTARIQALELVLTKVAAWFALLETERQVAEGRLVYPIDAWNEMTRGDDAFALAQLRPDLPPEQSDALAQGTVEALENLRQWVESQINLGKSPAGDS